MANVAAHPEDTNRATCEETMGATGDRSKDRRQAIRRRGRPKKRAQGNNGSQQKSAAANRRFTRLAVPPRLKACRHKGPMT
jgi:hypothetical protein